MTRPLTLILVLLSAALCRAGDLTLDYCLERAEENYPCIRKYRLLDNTSRLNIDEINRGWLPRIELSAQGSVQNVVPAFPDALRNMLVQNGFEMKGMGKIQYRVAAGLNQTIWDGGASQSARAVQRAATAASGAAVDVELYEIRSRVENLYFGILLLQQQVKQTEQTIELLDSNHRCLVSMVRNGTAMQSEADMVEAQILTLRQSVAQAISASEAYGSVLAIFIGEDLGGRTLICPEPVMPESTEPARPELTLFDKRIALNRARENAVKATVMPRIGFFTQAYYGYPGYNYFESMVGRTMSFNIMAGVKMSWNVESLYLRNTSRRKLLLDSEMVNADREVFLYNNRLQSSREEAGINGLREIMKDDARIVELRENVRRSAESQLRNGIIDATALLSKITDENQAKLNSAYHKIQLAQSIYKLKNTLNR